MTKTWKTKEDRASEMEEITKQLEEGVKKYFTSDSYKDYLTTMSRFHNYSFNNVMLIALQRPDSSMVAGYNTWKKLNRYVKKGENGIRILAPAPIKKEVTREVTDPVTKEKSWETVEKTIPMFKPAYVYDLAQTDGEPLKLPEISDLQGQVDGYEIIREAASRIAPVPISYERFDGSAKGYFHAGTNQIVIQDNLSELQTVKTLLHELSHSILHNKEQLKIDGPKDSKTKEVEAESVAFTVCTALGLDTSDYSFPYIALWAGDQDLPQLRSSMDYIRSTAADMIEDLQKEIGQIREEKMVNSLSEELVEFAILLDPYDYLDANHDKETALAEMKEHLLADGTKSIAREIQGIIQEHNDPEITESGDKLISNLTKLEKQMEQRHGKEIRQKGGEAR